MSATRKRETEKQRREKFELFCNTIPHDEATLLQHKKEIADALGVPYEAITAKMLGALKTIIKGLRDPDTFVIVRDPRVTWFTIHQVWKNCHVIRKHANVIREKLNLLPIAIPTRDESVTEVTSTVDGNVRIDPFPDADETSFAFDSMGSYDFRQIGPDMESVSPDAAPAVPATPNMGMPAWVASSPGDDNASSSDEGCAPVDPWPLDADSDFGLIPFEF